MPTRTISPEGLVALAQLPAFLQRDSTIAGILDVQASEFRDIELARNALLTNAIPYISQDPTMWEALLQLTPGGLSGQALSARIGAVLNALAQAVMDGSGITWVALMGQAFGGSFSYVEHDTGVRSIFDGFDDTALATSWTAFTGALGSLSIATGHLVSSGTVGITHNSTTGLVDIPNLRTRVLAGSQTIQEGHVFKWIDANNYLFAQLDKSLNQIQIKKSDLGVASNLATASFTPSSGTVYGLETVMASNVITLKIYDQAWQTVLQTATFTLVGADATKYGTGVPGKAGLILGNGASWYLDEFFLSGLVSTSGTPANYTIRVNSPFSSGSPQAALSEAVLRAITPAHLDISVVYADNFILGLDQLGLSTL